MTLWIPPKELHLPPHAPCAASPPGIIQAKLEIGVWDKRQHLIHQQLEPSRSPVKQFLSILKVQMWQSAIVNVVKDITGTGRTVGTSSLTLRLTAGATSDTGLVVGTSGTAVDIADYALGAQILHGSGAGQFVHNAVFSTVGSSADVTVDDPICYMEFYRNFNNNSGDSITVRETGIYAIGGGLAVAFCIFRDTPTAILVPDGGGCYVKYTLTISE